MNFLGLVIGGGSSSSSGMSGNGTAAYLVLVVRCDKEGLLDAEVKAWHPVGATTAVAAAAAMAVVRRARRCPILLLVENERPRE